MDGRRGIKGKEVWRARLRRNGILFTLGKGFETELEAVICVQQYLLAELEQVNSALQFPLAHISNHTAPLPQTPAPKRKRMTVRQRRQLGMFCLQPEAPFYTCQHCGRHNKRQKSLDSHLMIPRTVL